MEGTNARQNMAGKTGILAVVSILILAAAGGLLFTGYSLQSQPGEVTVGYIVPLSGDAAAIGIPLRNSATLAMDEINSHGGINGRPLRIIFEDGKCSGEGGASAAQKLINVDGVSVIIGGTCSSETLAASPISESSRVILFSPSSGSPDITNAGDYVFRNFPSDSTSGSKIAEAAMGMGLKRIGVISEINDAAQAVTEVFGDRFASLGGTMLSHETYTSDAVDVRTQVSKVLAKNPDAVYFVPSTPAKMGLILDELKKQGYDGPLLTNELVAGDDILASYGPEVERAIFAEPEFDPSDLVTKAFLDSYDSHFGKDMFDPPIYRAAAYDAVYIIKEAIEACGPEDTTCMRDYLYSINERRGAAGLLTIDKNGDADLEYVLMTIKNDKVAPYGS